jgi:hypothetical protein
LLRSVNDFAPWSIGDEFRVFLNKRVRYEAVPANRLEVGEQSQQVFPNQLAPRDELPFRTYQGRLVIEQFNLFQLLATIDA